jgi:hypothetical protein
MTITDYIQDATETLVFQARIDADESEVVRTYLTDCFVHGAGFEDINHVPSIAVMIAKELHLNREYTGKLINVGIELYRQGVLSRPVLEV